MAWVQERQRRGGEPFWSVYWREGGRKGKIECVSWNDYADALKCKDLVEKVGGEKAREVMKIVTNPRQAETLTQFLTKHIDRLTGIEPATAKRYRAYVANDIAPTIGEIPLTALSRDDIAGWVQNMKGRDGKPPSGKTVKNKRDFLSGALKEAAKAGTIKSNPAEDVRNPTWHRADMVFLEKDEFALLLSCIPEYWRPLVEFLVASGARWSEATALTPADINVKAGTVRIIRAWKSGGDDGGYEIGPTKTKMSVRTINVPARVIKQLDLTGEWVFTNSGRGKGKFADGAIREDRGPVRAHSFNPNVWVPAVTRAKEKGLTKRPRVHDLRHTCASWLIQAGRPLPAIQAQLGHESIQTTVNVYGHLDRSSGQDNAAAIDAMLTM